LRLLALLGRYERHRWMRRKADLPRAVVGREPKLDFRPGGGIAPVSGQKKSLL
jgi:hypothetical protein